MGIASKIAKNSVFGIASSISELGISFFIGILLARGLGAEQYGLYSYLAWFLGITAMIVNLGLGEMSRRFIPESQGRGNTTEAIGFVRMTLTFRIIASIFVTLVVVFSSGFWANLAGAPSDQFLFIIIALSILPQGVQLALSNVFKGFQRFSYDFYLVLASQPLRLVAIIILSMLKVDILSILLVNLATYFIAIIFGFFLLNHLIPLKKLLSSSVSAENRSRAIKYAATVAGILVVGYLADSQAEIFIVGLFCSIEQVGFYRLAFLIGQIVGVAPMAINLTLLPAIAEQNGKGDMHTIRQIYLTSMRYLMIVSVPSGIGAIVLAQPVISVLYGSEYLPSVVLIQIIMIPMVITLISGGISNTIRAINHPGFILNTTIITAIIKIGLSFWLISQYGIMGAAISISVIYVITFIIRVWFISKKLEVTWPFKDTFAILVSSLIMGIIIYFIQNSLNEIASLIICIPSGILLYTFTLLTFKVIRENDLILLDKIGDQLPHGLRQSYLFFYKVIQRYVMIRLGHPRVSV